jgi:MYXO-CTERM domain-containing protein
MKFIHCLFLAALLPLSSFGAAGMFDQYIIVNTGGVAYFDIGASTANPDFQGASLGTFTSSDSLLLGGQGKSFKNNGSDVNGMQLFYRLWQGTPSGSFSQFNYAFQIDNVGGTPGDQQWGSDVAGFNGSSFYTGNLLTGLANGNYSLEVFSRITTNGNNAAAEIFNNAGGSNFTSAFTVVPEPSRALFSLIGLGALVLRRRRA